MNKLLLFHKLPNSIGVTLLLYDFSFWGYVLFICEFIFLEAKAKAILKLMDSDGLTIFNVKSYLQVLIAIQEIPVLLYFGAFFLCFLSHKYRIAKNLPDSAEGKLLLQLTS